VIGEGRRLASAGPDPELRELVRAYQRAHDDVARNWSSTSPAQHQALRNAYSQAMERVAAIMQGV
jgi:hypothetical protein